MTEADRLQAEARTKIVCADCGSDEERVGVAYGDGGGTTVCARCGSHRFIIRTPTEH